LQLVEQGEAPLAERPRPRPMQLQTAPRTGGNGFKMAALLLLLAAGGGGAWWAFGGHRAIADNGRHGPTRSEVAAAIDDVRVELRRSGPSAALQQRLTAIDTEDAESSQSKAALLDQLTQATSIKNRLAALEKPETLQLPFTDLRRYYQGLNELEATIRKAGADLQAWASKQVLAARAEGELQGKAQSALMAKWVLWSSELQRANGDAGVLHGLSERLDVITAARALLLEILPGSASALGLELSEQQLLAAHDQVVASRPTDVGARLLAASEKFRREGPTALLRAEVEKITTVDAAQQQLRDRLFDDISRAVEIKATLDNLRAQKTLRAPVPPFTDIRDYYSGIDNALGNLSGRGEEFRAWAAWAAAEARDAAAVRQAASAALAKAWAEWQQARSDAGSDTARLESLRPRLAELENGRRQLGSLCGLDEAELEKIMPAAAAVAAATDLGSVVREQQLLDAIGASSRQLDGISTLKDWLAAQAKLEPAAAGHQHALAELPAAPRARAAIEHLNAGVARWQRAAADALSIVTTLDQGLLADAAERLAAARDTPSDVRDLGVVIEHCSAAFKTLRTELLLDEARKKLRAAHEVTSRLGPFADAVGRRIDAWLAIVDRMEATVKQFDMVPIAGDLVPGPTGQAVPVDAFFLSRAETSRGEFLQFVKELQQLLAPLGDGNWPEKLQQVNPRLGGVLLDEAQLRGLLDKQIAIDPDNPIDRLSWYEATVCARWQHATLLTAAEWSLAALGPQNNRYKYPWGREWTADAGDRNLGNRELAKVRVGGLSWRKGQGVQIHHLGGNVAEWLADGPADDRGWLAGGKYNDLEKVAKEQAAGTMREEPRTQALSGFGMRTGLRPRDCFGSQWPH
ncbi:MAG TPA: SUMF1/EgtB/PvdO family nonheme iron enzyme, partial [Planctomycetota bacterium]|nr:SUMF1/EgtB/PvdO family nonheme iron enzyme [Planctomycetota bacterium]